MSEPTPSRSYVVGDEVTMRAVVEHELNLYSMQVNYVHFQDPSITPTIDGVPDDATSGSMSGTFPRRTETLVSGVVDLEHIPGIYILLTVTLYTAGGQSLVYHAGELDFIELGYPVLRVVEESRFVKVYLSLEEDAGP